MRCVFSGNFQELHKDKKNRRMIGLAKSRAISAVIDQGKSSENYRESEAVRLLALGKKHYTFNNESYSLK